MFRHDVMPSYWVVVVCHGALLSCLKTGVAKEMHPGTTFFLWEYRTSTRQSQGVHNQMAQTQSTDNQSINQSIALYNKNDAR